MPPFNFKLDNEKTGISNYNSKINFKELRKCLPMNYSLTYSGKLQNIYSGKYSPENTEIEKNNCSGFFGMDLLPTEERTQIFIAFMHNINFFDFNTEFFLIQFNGYNLNKNIWVTVKLIFEQSDNGLTATSYNLCTLNMFGEIASFINFKLELESIIRTFVLLVIALYTIFATWDIIKCLVTDYKEYFKDIWNIFKIVKVTMYLLSTIIRVIIYLTIFDLIGKKDIEQFIDTDSVCGLYNALLLLETLMACFTLVYFLKFLDKNIIEPISLTIQESLSNIIVFLTSFVTNILGFSMFCYFIYGGRSLSKFFYILISS